MYILIAPKLYYPGRADEVMMMRTMTSVFGLKNANGSSRQQSISEPDFFSDSATRVVPLDQARRAVLRSALVWIVTVLVADQSLLSFSWLMWPLRFGAPAAERVPRRRGTIQERATRSVVGRLQRSYKYIPGELWQRGCSSAIVEHQNLAES